MKRVFYSDVFRTIRHSLSRFLAIVFIVALGTGFYAGLGMAGPSMRNAATSYYESSRLFDLRLVSDQGFSDKDASRVADLEGVASLMQAHEQDVLALFGDEYYATQLASLPSSDLCVPHGTQALNQVHLVEGRMPTSPHECVALARTTGVETIPLGSEISLVPASGSKLPLTSDTLTLVGTVESPLFISSAMMGPSRVGGGTLRQSLLVLPRAFTQDAPVTSLYLAVDNTQDVSEVSARIEAQLGSLQEASRQERLEAMLARFSNMSEGRAEQAGLVSSASSELAATLVGSPASNTPGDVAQPGFATTPSGDQEALGAYGGDSLTPALSSVGALPPPNWTVFDRDSNPGIASYEADAQRMQHIAGVFPVLFLAVALLVSLTTMTRLIEDERLFIGTAKALGMSSAQIASKYLIYGLASAGLGGLVGVGVLSQLLPRIIHEAYAVVYSIPEAPLYFDLAQAGFAVAIGLVLVLSVVCAVCYTTLSEVPAALLLPKAPRSGKKILAERTALWKHLSFSWKVVLRNIFRYKRRFFMTVLGLAGSSALLLTGLGLADAVGDITRYQFDRIQHFDARAALVPGADASDFEASLDASPAVASYTRVQESNLLIRQGDDSRPVQLVVIEDPKAFSDFVSLRTRNQSETLDLMTDGAILSEKLAQDFNLGPGSSFELFELDALGKQGTTSHTLEVSALTENYLGNYVYISPRVYEQLYSAAPVFDHYLIRYAHTSQASPAPALRALDSVQTYSENDELITSYTEMLSSVHMIVALLVVSAGLLVFIVLYNLMNINISERVREIATLKVLGFYPREVDAYIFREVLMLSLIGASFGMLLGTGMEQFVAQTAETNYVMFGRDIHITSYVIAWLATMIFAGCSCLLLKPRLSRVDMVTSLKSVE